MRKQTSQKSTVISEVTENKKGARFILVMKKIAALIWRFFEKDCCK